MISFNPKNQWLGLFFKSSCYFGLRKNINTFLYLINFSLNNLIIENIIKNLSSNNFVHLKCHKFQNLSFPWKQTINGNENKKNEYQNVLIKGCWIATLDDILLLASLRRSFEIKSFSLKSPILLMLKLHATIL